MAYRFCNVFCRYIKLNISRLKYNTLKIYYKTLAFFSNCNILFTEEHRLRD